MKYFIILISAFIITLVAPFELKSVYAIPAYCNYSPTVSNCCGRTLACSFPDFLAGEELWCGGPIVPNGVACPF